MPRTDVSDARETVKDNAVAALGTVRTQATAAGETLGAAMSSALDVASVEGKKAGMRAQKRAMELAEEAAKSASRSARKARQRADEAARKANKKANKKAAKKLKKRARELSLTVQEKAGRKPRRSHKKVVVLGGVAITGAAVAAVISRKRAEPPVQEVPGEPSSQR